jgi:hypothetical protein
MLESKGKKRKKVKLAQKKRQKLKKKINEENYKVQKLGSPGAHGEKPFLLLGFGAVITPTIWL